MTACPWCSRPIERLDALCPACKRDPRHHPSFAAGPSLDLDLPVAPASAPQRSASVASARPAAHAPSGPTDSIPPPLDVDLGVPSRAPASAPKAPPPAPVGVDGFDDEPIEALDVDIAGPPVPKSTAPTPAAAPPVAHVAAVHVVDRRAATAPDVPLVDVDPADAALVADFGPPPPTIFHAPAYAIRVFRRKLELKKEIAAAKKRLEDVREEELLRLTRLVESVGPKASADHPIKAHLQPLVHVDEIAKSRGVALEAMQSEASRSIGAADAEVSAKERERMKLEEELAAAQEVLRARHEEKTRAEGKVKRVEIELRAAHEAARIAAGPEAKFAPPEHAKKIKVLEGEKQARAAELAPFVASFDEALAVVRGIEERIRAVRRAVDALRDKRAKTETQASHKVALRSESARQAERARNEAYADVARVLLRDYADLVDAGARADLAFLDERVKKAERDLATHARAMTTEDKQGLQRGLIVLGFAALCLIAFFATIIRVR